MRISAILVPFFALLTGAAGYYLRMLELWNIFETETGLPRTGAVITYLLIGLAIAYLFIMLLYSLHTRRGFSSPRGFKNAFGAEPVTYPFVFSLVGAIWLIATIISFISMNAQGDILTAELFFFILSALSAISVSLFAIEIYLDSHRKSKLVLSIVPTLFMCFWLIRVYSENASNPILLSYCYQCLAIISATLGFYFTSGFVYNRSALAKTIFAYCTAIFFCFVTLADEHTTGIKLIFFCIIVINAINLSMLIKNMQIKNDLSEHNG